MLQRSPARTRRDPDLPPPPIRAYSILDEDADEILLGVLARDTKPHPYYPEPEYREPKSGPWWDALQERLKEWRDLHAKQREAERQAREAAEAKAQKQREKLAKQKQQKQQQRRREAQQEEEASEWQARLRRIEEYHRTEADRKAAAERAQQQIEQKREQLEKAAEAALQLAEITRRRWVEVLERTIETLQGTAYEPILIEVRRSLGLINAQPPGKLPWRFDLTEFERDLTRRMSQIDGGCYAV